METQLIESNKTKREREHLEKCSSLLNSTLVYCFANYSRCNFNGNKNLILMDEHLI